MAAELVAQGGEEALGEWVVLAGAEAREERRGDDGQRHAALDRLDDRPAALT